MIKAVALNKSLIIDLLIRSFETNKSVNYIVKYSRVPKRGIYALVDYSFEVCLQYGEIWIADDRKGCALILFPHLRCTTIAFILLDLKLIFQAIGLRGISRALPREAKIKTIQPKMPMAYLWFIGIDPAHQHQGIGTALLNEVKTEKVRKNLPVYLETSSQQNLPCYKKHGFEIYDELQLNYTLFFLKHLPNQRK